MLYNKLFSYEVHVSIMVIQLLLTTIIKNLDKISYNILQRFKEPLRYLKFIHQIFKKDTENTNKNNTSNNVLSSLKAYVNQKATVQPRKALETFQSHSWHQTLGTSKYPDTHEPLFTLSDALKRDAVRVRVSLM